MSWKDSVKKAKDRPQLFEDVQILVGDDLITVRVFKVPGVQWNEAVALSGPREGSMVDELRGFDADSVARALLVEFAAVVEDGEVKRLTEDEWAELYGVIEGEGIEGIANTFWVQNQVKPVADREAAKKALSGSGVKKSGSL